MKNFLQKLGAAFKSGFLGLKGWFKRNFGVEFFKDCGRALLAGITLAGIILLFIWNVQWGCFLLLFILVDTVSKKTAALQERNLLAAFFIDVGICVGFVVLSFFIGQGILYLFGAQDLFDAFSVGFCVLSSTVWLILVPWPSIEAAVASESEKKISDYFADVLKWILIAAVVIVSAFFIVKFGMPLIKG